MVTVEEMKRLWKRMDKIERELREKLLTSSEERELRNELGELREIYLNKLVNLEAHQWETFSQWVMKQPD